MIMALLTLLSCVAFAAPADGANSLFNFQLSGGSDWTENVNIMVVLTILTLSPAIILTMTCFPRYIISLSFVRQALGIQQIPPNQVLVGIAFFMTLYTMNPTFTDIYQNAYKPYQEHKIESKEFADKALTSLKKFMVSQTREKDLLLFAKHANIESLPESKEQLGILIVTPAFIISELKIAFTIGFLTYLAFLAIDFIVAFVLMSMGLMMLPPMMISLPLKILLFIITDGWYIIVDKLMHSFL